MSLSALSGLSGISGIATMPDDALAFISKVEAADGQALEAGVRDAFIDFVNGCKTDGIWDAIKACCIMAGARTLAGALVPLKGAAPTNFNFVAGDYNRKTGLRSSASNKYLNSNRPRNADPQNNAHLSVFVTEHITVPGFAAYAGSIISSPSFRGFRIFRDTDNNRLLAATNSTSNIPFSNSADAVGFIGASRGGASSATARVEGVTTSSTVASDHVGAFNIIVFTQSVDGAPPGNSTISRMSFYSIGEDVTLSLLDARVTALMTAIDNAI
jgi:hypothetical protein